MRACVRACVSACEKTSTKIVQCTVTRTRESQIILWLCLSFFSRKLRKLPTYRKIPMISPGLIFVQKAFFGGLIFGGAYFRRGLLLEGILRFKMGWD